MQRNAPVVTRTRLALAGSALFGLSCLLAWQHRDVDDGLRAEDIAQTTIEQELAEGQDGRQLLLDLVEPEDGEGGSEAELERLVRSLGLRAEPAGFYSETEHLWRVHGSPEQLAALQRELADHPLIEGVEADVTYSLPSGTFSVLDQDQVDDGADIAKPPRPRFVPNDPMYKLQWHLDAINVPEAWMHTRGRGATVAVIDTGVAYKDLEWKKVSAKAVPDLAGIEFVHGKSFVSNGLPDGLDDHAHGTHVTGTVAQATDNGVGVAGIAHKAKIMPLKVLGATGGGSVADIANAIRYAADNGADVINMSLGGPLPSRVMAKAVAYAHDKGVTVVCAAGNEKRSRVSYPAAYEGSVAVAATDYEGKRSFYSNWGKQLDISAPGGDTRSDKNGDGQPDGVLQNTIAIQDPSRNDYLWFQGTSMASPHAAGVAGMIVAQGVTNPKEVERILKETAVHPNKKEWDKEYGAGIIDAEAAAIAARSSYRGERLGFAGLLGLVGLGGLGFAGIGAAAMTGSARRRKLIAGTGLVAGLGLSVGAVTMPAAYMLGGLTTWLGSGLFLSALLPVLLTVVLLQIKSLRGFLAGLSLGWAALLVHGAVVLPTLIEGVPGGAGWDRLWLAGNAALCLWLAHRVGRAGTDSPSDAT
ncbi:Thermophilic serine proteinase precursor [Enhygromyxa salina]|uniref:Thermophilic serine proteinase n=1 Tax=Enhygromyxa salina TaxID=215803 RepID=A0A2S9XJ27_9BACT|nr:S8 family peptidase [Enhygromyxa salina]PRP92879.1 Thermophilic serine proteinase precursor [Enhygromyxa salina]